MVKLIFLIQLAIFFIPLLVLGGIVLQILWTILNVCLLPIHLIVYLLRRKDWDWKEYLKYFFIIVIFYYDCIKFMIEQIREALKTMEKSNE